jgi:hypothetical protein
MRNLPVKLAIEELSFVRATVCPLSQSRPRYFVVSKFALILPAVAQLELSTPVHLAIQPLTLILKKRILEVAFAVTAAT